MQSIAGRYLAPEARDTCLGTEHKEPNETGKVECGSKFPKYRHAVQKVPGRETIEPVPVACGKKNFRKSDVEPSESNQALYWQHITIEPA